MKLMKIGVNWSAKVDENWWKLMKIDENWRKLKKLWKLDKEKKSKNWVKLHEIRKVGWNCENWANWGKLRKIAKNCISSCRGSAHHFFFEKTNSKLGEIGANWVKLEEISGNWNVQFLQFVSIFVNFCNLHQFSPTFSGV